MQVLSYCYVKCCIKLWICLLLHKKLFDHEIRAFYFVAILFHVLAVYVVFMRMKKIRRFL